RGWPYAPVNCGASWSAMTSTMFGFFMMSVLPEKRCVDGLSGALRRRLEVHRLWASASHP
ncbi:MAG: hypothetical protein AAFQ73_09900, partial [Pseudomonadota bacterium]